MFLFLGCDEWCLNVNVAWFFVAHISLITIIVQKYKKISIMNRFFLFLFEESLKKERI